MFRECQPLAASGPLASSLLRMKTTMRHSLAVAFVAALALSAACNREDANAGAPGSNTNTNSSQRRDQNSPPRTNESTKTPEQRPLEQGNNPSSNAVDMRITQDIHK